MPPVVHRDAKVSLPHRVFDDGAGSDQQRPKVGALRSIPTVGLARDVPSKVLGIERWRLIGHTGLVVDLDDLLEFASRNQVPAFLFHDSSTTELS